MAVGQLYVMELVPTGWATITNPEAAELCGISCIKGVAFTARMEHWATNKPVYIPIAHIKIIYAFDSAEDYIESRKRARLAELPDGPHRPSGNQS